MLGKWKVSLEQGFQPEFQAGVLKPRICIGDWHLGHLITGLGRGVLASIMTFKTSCTKDNHFLELPCKNP